MLESLPLLNFTPLALLATALVFVWTGFVRSGLGFGGAALGLPLMLFIDDSPVFWLPIIGFHLLFFSSLTLRNRLHDVDWSYLKSSLRFILPAALLGVFGLLNLPNFWLLLMIYGITLVYAVMWILDWTLRSRSGWLDRFLLAFGGYVAGTSLTGAPLLVAVYLQHVSAQQLRNTLFVLWFVLVTLKMLTFAVLQVPLGFFSALLLLPVAFVGHIVGMKAHAAILQNASLFRRITGAVLLVTCLLGLGKLFL